jgi:hypothetical protein
MLEYVISVFFLWLTEMKNFWKYLVSFFSKIIIVTLNLKELICPPPSNCLDDNDVIAVIITKDFNSI